jgi:WD40 repeat protein
MLRVLSGHTKSIRTLAFSPDGRTLASADGSLWSNITSTLKLWDVASGVERRGPVMTHEGPIYSLAFAPDGKTVATASADQSVKLWDVTTGKLRTTLLGHTNSVTGVAYAPNGRSLVSVGYDQSVRFWDAATGQELATLKDYRYALYSVAFSPNGRTLATGGSLADKCGGIRLWHAAPMD